MFAQPELEAALKAVLSTIHKSERVQATLSAKQPPRTAQLKAGAQKLKALRIAADLIEREMEAGITVHYALTDLEDAIQTTLSFIRQIEKVKPNFAEGTPQHTLAVRRIRAFEIAVALMEREMAKD